MRALHWEDAHASYDAAVDRIPVELRGNQPAGMPWSCWQLVEHLRLTQRDILEFCIDSNYKERNWPEDYWPQEIGPSTPEDWDRSLAEFGRDREQLIKLAGNPKVDLLAPIPHGSEQTILREILLVIDHNSYHVGQLIAVRRLLGIWP